MSENESKQGVASRLSSTKSSVLSTSSARSHGIVSNAATTTNTVVSTGPVRVTPTSTTNKTKEAVMIPNHKQTKPITPAPTPPTSKTNTPTTTIRLTPAAITARVTTSSQYPSSTRMMHGSILNASNRHPSTMAPSASSASKYPWIPPEHNQFHRRKFVLSYCHTGDSDASGRQRPDECPQQLAALGAEIVPELTKDVFALVVDDEERSGENRRPRKSEEKSNQLIKNKDNRFMKAITSSSSSSSTTPPTRSTSVSTVNSTPSSASQTSTSLSSTIAAAATPVLDARRTLAQNLNIQVWTRSRLIKELQATFNSIQSPRTDLPPCSAPRLIIEDVDQKYRPSIKVFALINPLKPSSSRGSKNSLEYECTPVPTYGQLDENYHGHGSPFMFGHRLTSHNSTTHHHKATTPAPKKRTFCEICNEDFADSEQEHFITPKHYQLYHDPNIWRESRLRAAEMRERDERARKAAEPMDVSRYAPVQQKCILDLRRQLLASADEEVWEMVFRGDVQWEYFVEHAVEYGFKKELAQALQQLKEDADNKQPQSGTSEQNVALVETNTRDDAKLADDQPIPIEIDDENKEKRDESDADESSDSSDDDSDSDDDSENEDEQKESTPLSPIPTPKSSNLKPSLGEPIETIDLTMDLLTPTSSPSQSHPSSTPRRSGRPLTSRHSIALVSPLPPAAQNSVRAPKQDEVWMKFLDPTIPTTQPTESNETEAASAVDIMQLPNLNQQLSVPSTEPETDVVLSPPNELLSDLTDQPVESNEVGGGRSPSLLSARRGRPRKTADPSATSTSTSTAIDASSSDLAPSSPPPVVAPASSRHRKNHKKGATPQHPELSTISASAPILANFNSPQPGLTPSATKRLMFEEEKERRVPPRKAAATTASASTKASEAAAAAAPMASATSFDHSSPIRGNDRKKRHNQQDASKLNSGRSTRSGVAALLSTSTSSPSQLTPNDRTRSGRSRYSVASAADTSSSQPSKVTLDASLTTVEVDEPVVDVDAGAVAVAASTGLQSPPIHPSTVAVNADHGSGRTTRRSTRDEPATPSSVRKSITRSGRKVKKENGAVISDTISSSPVSAASPSTSHQPTRPSTRSGSHQLPSDSGITSTAIVTSTSGPLLSEDESRTKRPSRSSTKKRLFDGPPEKRASPRKSSTNSATIDVATAAATTPTSVTSPPSAASPSHAPLSAASASDSKKPRTRRNPLAEYNASGPGFPEATTIDLGSGRSTRKAVVALKSDSSTTTSDHTPQLSTSAVATSSRKRKKDDSSPTSVAAVPMNSSPSTSIGASAALEIVPRSPGSDLNEPSSGRLTRDSVAAASLDTVPTSAAKSAKRNGHKRKPGNMESPTSDLSLPMAVDTPSTPQQLPKRASARSSGRSQVEDEPVAASSTLAAASSPSTPSSQLPSAAIDHTPKAKAKRLKMTPIELVPPVAASVTTSVVSPPPVSSPAGAPSAAPVSGVKQVRIPRDLAPYLHSGSSFPEAMSIDLDAGRLTRKATGAIKSETEPISSVTTTVQPRSTTKATSDRKPKKDESLSVTSAPISPTKSSKRSGHKRKADSMETSPPDSSSSETMATPSSPQQQHQPKRSSGRTQVEDETVAVFNSSKAPPSELSSTSNIKQVDESKVPTTPARTIRQTRTHSGGATPIPTTPVATAAVASSLHPPSDNVTPKSKRVKLESTRSGTGSSSAASSAPSDTPTLPSELNQPEPSTKTAKKRTTNTTNRAIRELGSFFSSPLRRNQVPMDSVSSSRSATKQLIEQVSQQRKSTRTETATSTKEDQTPTPTTTSKKKNGRKNTKLPSTLNVDRAADLASTTPTSVAPPATATSTTFSSTSPTTPKQEPHDLTTSHTPTRSGRTRNSINSSENSASMIEPTASGRRSSQRHPQPDKSMMELKSNERIDPAGQLLSPVPGSLSSSSLPPAFFTPRVEDTASTSTMKKKSHLTNKPIPRKLHLSSEFEVTDQAATNAPNETVPNNSGKKRGRPKKKSGANSTPQTDATLIIGAADVVTSAAHAAPSATATHHLDSLSPDRKMQRELARLGTYLSDGHRQEHTIDLESILISTQMTQSSTLTTPTTRRTSTTSSMLTSTVASQSKVKERTPKRKHMEPPDTPSSSSTRARGINATTTTIMSQDEDIEMVSADEELPPPTTTNRRPSKKRKLLVERADELKENHESDLSPSVHSPSKHPKKYKPSALASLPSPSMVNNIPTSSLAPFLSPHIPVTPTTTMVVKTRLCTQVVRSSMKAPSDSPLTNALVTPGKLEQELVGNKRKNKKGLLFQPLLIDQSPTTITPTITDQHSSPPIRPSTAAAAAASSTSSAGPSPSFGSPVPFPLLNSPPPSSSLPSNSFLSARPPLLSEFALSASRPLSRSMMKMIPVEIVNALQSNREGEKVKE